MSADDQVTFVDSNVLIYAYDRDAGWKHDAVAAELQRLWDSQTGVLSSQVLQEFYVTVTRKLSRPLPKHAAWEVLTTYDAWPVHRPDVGDLLDASSLEERHSLSFWDALIVVSAQRLGARLILTEDLQAGRRFAETSIANPFAGGRSSHEAGD